MPQLVRRSLGGGRKVALPVQAKQNQLLQKHSGRAPSRPRRIGRKVLETGVNYFRHKKTLPRRAGFLLIVVIGLERVVHASTEDKVFTNGFARQHIGIQ